jgi:hypothetical protein
MLQYRQQGIKTREQTAGNKNARTGITCRGIIFTMNFIKNQFKGSKLKETWTKT